MTRMSQLEHNNRSAKVWQDLHDTSGLGMALTLAYDEVWREEVKRERVENNEMPIISFSYSNCVTNYWKKLMSWMRRFLVQMFQ
jgi:hypothetical protein